MDVGPGRDEAGAAFAAVVPDLEAVDPAVRIPTIIAGVFGAAALRRAEDLVPRAEAWRPDLVVHPITELAGAVAAERVGAAALVHGFGPLPAEAWTWFGARFGELCDAWDVPELVDGILESPFVELCPPSLQRDAVAAFAHRVPMRPGSGDVGAGRAPAVERRAARRPPPTPTPSTSRSARCSTRPPTSSRPPSPVSRAAASTCW